ncbi:MAG: DUF411 domain-containing protein [Gemmatimonadota bacterium]|nr:DUF411 domain-containing protein [Gemmatimonadota bacterium]
MHSIRRVGLLSGMVMLVVSTGAAAHGPTEAHALSKDPTITVYRDPSCGCCTKWIEHLVKHGFRVNDKKSAEMTEIKRGLGVPESLESCHTGVVNGYVIEGHVPAADIKRLLKAKPKVAGLAVPGMPMGSPGMEGPRTDRYDVLSFDKRGKTRVYAKH